MSVTSSTRSVTIDVPSVCDSCGEKPIDGLTQVEGWTNGRAVLITRCAWICDMCLPDCLQREDDE